MSLAGQPDMRPRITCTACRGGGRVVGSCATCGSAGYVRTITAAHACPDCDNARCRRCGGSGREIVNG